MRIVGEVVAKGVLIQRVGSGGVVGLRNRLAQAIGHNLTADLGEKPAVGKPIVLHDGIAMIEGTGATQVRPNRAQRLGESSGDMARFVVNGPFTVDNLHDVVGSHRYIVIGGFTTVDADAFEVDAGSSAEQRAEFGL